MDISLTIHIIHPKFSVCILKVLLQGSVSRIFYSNGVGDMRPDISKVYNRVECNISLTSQMCCLLIGQSVGPGFSPFS